MDFCPASDSTFLCFYKYWTPGTADALPLNSMEGSSGGQKGTKVDLLRAVSLRLLVKRDLQESSQGDRLPFFLAARVPHSLSHRLTSTPFNDRSIPSKVCSYLSELPPLSQY